MLSRCSHSKILLSWVTIERIPLSILFTISIILKVTERLVRAGADVRRCKNAKRFKTNSEVFDATDIKQTHTQKVYKIYQIRPESTGLKKLDIDIPTPSQGNICNSFCKIQARPGGNHTIAWGSPGETLWASREPTFEY